MLAFQRKLTNGFYLLLSLPATAMGFALSVQISALSWILSTKYGLEIHEIGLVWAAGPIAGIFGQVIVGLISDNVWFWGGRRRPFILIGGVLATLMLLALPSIDVISEGMGFSGILGVAIAVALTLDMAINISFNPTRSVIADVTPEGNARTKGYTWMQTVSGSFGVMAYAIGAIWNNYVLIFGGAGLVFLFSVLPPLFITEEREMVTEDEQTGNSGGSFMDIVMAIKPLWGFVIYAIYAMTIRLGGFEITHHWVEIGCGLLTALLFADTLLRRNAGPGEDGGSLAFRKVLAAHSFTWIGVQAMFIYMFSYVQQELPNLSEVNQGRVVSISFLVLNAVGALLPAFVLEPLTERFGRVRVHAACIAIMALGYAGVLFLGHSAMLIYVFMGVTGIGWAATVSLPFAIMSQQVSKARMGLYMGLFNLSVVLPQLVASLGVGQAVNDAENKSLLWVICAICLAISAVLWMFVPEGKSNEEQGAGA